jgi:hypothetical protein
MKIFSKHYFSFFFTLSSKGATKGREANFTIRKMNLKGEKTNFRHSVTLRKD